MDQNPAPMTDAGEEKKNVLEEIVNKNLGGKRYHSETSLQQYGEDDVFDDRGEKDPGVHNASLGDLSNLEDTPARRRTMSQPGPISGSLLTATAARAARKRPPRNVMYAPELERTIRIYSGQRYKEPISGDNKKTKL